MPLDWLNTPIDSSSVSDLLTRKKRAKAIETLRECNGNPAEAIIKLTG